MLALLIVVVICAVGAPKLWRVMVEPPEEQALAGFFGEPERERVIARRCARVTEAAEACIRLGTFVADLDGVAWNGTPLRITPSSARGWAEWTFADGRSCRVRHGRRSPRKLRRVIVAGAAETPTGLAVAAYGARAGHPPVVLDVRDVAP